MTVKEKLHVTQLAECTFWSQENEIHHRPPSVVYRRVVHPNVGFSSLRDTVSRTEHVLFSLAKCMPGSLTGWLGEYS